MVETTKHEAAEKITMMAPFSKGTTKPMCDKGLHMLHVPYMTQKPAEYNKKMHQSGQVSIKVANTIIEFTEQHITEANRKRKQELQLIKTLANQQIQTIYELCMIQQKYNSLKAMLMGVNDTKISKVIRVICADTQEKRTHEAEDHKKFKKIPKNLQAKPSFQQQQEKQAKSTRITKDNNNKKTHKETYRMTSINDENDKENLKIDKNTEETKEKAAGKKREQQISALMNNKLIKDTINKNRMIMEEPNHESSNFKKSNYDKHKPNTEVTDP